MSQAEAERGSHRAAFCHPRLTRLPALPLLRRHLPPPSPGLSPRQRGAAPLPWAGKGSEAAVTSCSTAPARHGTARPGSPPHGGREQRRTRALGHARSVTRGPGGRAAFVIPGGGAESRAAACGEPPALTALRISASRRRDARGPHSHSGGTEGYTINISFIDVRNPTGQLAAQKHRYKPRPLHLCGNPTATVSAAQNRHPHTPGTPADSTASSPVLPPQPGSCPLPQAWPCLCKAAMRPRCKAAGPTAGKALAQQSHCPTSSLPRALSCCLRVILIDGPMEYSSPHGSPRPTCTPQHSTTAHSTWGQGGSRSPPAGHDGWCPRTARMKHCFIACLGWVRPCRRLFSPCAALLSPPASPSG